MFCLLAGFLTCFTYEREILHSVISSYFWLLGTKSCQMLLQGPVCALLESSNYIIWNVGLIRERTLIQMLKYLFLHTVACKSLAPVQHSGYFM